MKPWPYPALIAHRGGGIVAPENTLAAFRLGRSLGFRAAEFDVKLTRDDVAILLHDATLDRTTNARGPVGDLDWSQVRGLDAGGWLGEAFRGEPVATFDAVAELLRSTGMHANVEIKPVPGRDRDTGFAVAARAAALWEGAAVAPLLSSFSFEALEAAREAAPALPRGLIVSVPQDADFRRMAHIEAVSLHCSRKAADRDLIARAHGAGLRVLVWTVDDPPEAERLLGWGADSIITDNVRQFAARFPDLL